jgi:hypothetical protein
MNLRKAALIAFSRTQVGFLSDKKMFLIVMDANLTRIDCEAAARKEAVDVVGANVTNMC